MGYLFTRDMKKEEEASKEIYSDAATFFSFFLSLYVLVAKLTLNGQTVGNFQNNSARRNCKFTQQRGFGRTKKVSSLISLNCSTKSPLEV